MKFINAIIGYLSYFLSQKNLIKKSFRGALIQLGVRLPEGAINEISENIFDIYDKNKKIDKVMKRHSIANNMERMWDLIQYEAYYIRDLTQETYVYIPDHTSHKNTINILKKYGVQIFNYRDN